jgi:lipoprotein-releasing system permease protein
MRRMFRPFPIYIGLRYTRAKRRNHFISFISLTSMLGIALGVTALITVLSVMNGFEKELRERMLVMAAHVVINAGQPIAEWREIAATAAQNPAVRGVAPYLQGQAMLVNNQVVRGTIIQGILPEEEPKISDVEQKMLAGGLAELKAGEFNILIGRELALSLGVGIGTMVTVVVPQATVTPVGVLPRMKRMRVAGVFEVGMHDFDSGIVLMHMDDAAKLLRQPEGHAEGLNVKLHDMFQAVRVGRELQQELPDYHVYDWTYRHANFFRAVKMEKTVMFIILMLIVAVAAFNIISTLVMVVTDKQADIAILRTLGATPRAIMAIFMTQGTIIGVVGTVLGLIGGVSLALNVENVIPWIESVAGQKILNPEIYYITDLPSDLHWDDVFKITGMSLLLSLLATLYPAWRASRTQPAEALRYE